LGLWHALSLGKMYVDQEADTKIRRFMYVCKPVSKVLRTLKVLDP